MKQTMILAALVSVLGACGHNGKDGSSCSVVESTDGSATITCPDGSSYTVGNGTNGTNGANGASCTVLNNPDATATITCPDGTMATVGTPQTQYASVLTAVSEGNPEGRIVLAGSTMQLASKYRFSALREGFTVRKLTVINDVSGPFDAPEYTNASSEVIIRYLDINGVTQVMYNAMAHGSATFSGLSFYVPAGQDAFFEIYAGVNSMSAVGETLSGTVFRMGILETGNTVSTFEAVGVRSSVSVPANISSGSSVNSFTVRKSVPTFTKVPGLSTVLANGTNRLYGVQVCADNAGPVSLGKWTYEFAAASVSLVNHRVYRGSTQLDASVAITGVGNHILVAFLQGETIGGGHLPDLLPRCHSLGRHRGEHGGHEADHQHGQSVFPAERVLELQHWENISHRRNINLRELRGLRVRGCDRGRARLVG